MAEVDLYKFRGFQVYTPELPDAPEEPLFGIKFFWPGIDSVTGLVRCDPYSGKDYTGGEWIRYLQNYNGTTVSSAIPKNFVSTSDNPNTDTKYLTWPTHGGYDLAWPQIDNLSITIPSSGFTIGAWLYQDGVTDNTNYPIIRIYDSDDKELYWGNYADYWTIGSTSLGQYKYATHTATGWRFVQFVVDYTNLTITLLVNGSEVGLSGNDFIAGWEITNIKKIYLDLQTSTKDASGINSLIYSEDLTLNMYTQLYNGTRICNLTEYPKLLSPTITTQPQDSSFMDSGVLSVVASANGGTLSYQWQQLIGSTWTNISGATDDELTVTEAGDYRVNVSNSAGSVTSDAATVTMLALAYTKTVPLSHTGELTDYQIRLKVNRTTGADSGNEIFCSTHIKSDYSDIRFYNAGGDLLPYWLEPDYTSSIGYIWVKVDTIETADDLVVKYGNASVTSASSITDTFVKADDFNRADSSTVGSDWVQASGCAIASNKLTITDPGGAGSFNCYLPFDDTGFDCVVEAKVKSSNPAAGNYTGLNLYGVANYVIGCAFSAAGNYISWLSSSGWQATANAANADTYYLFGIQWDYTNNISDIYVDGTKIADNQSPYGDTNARKVGFFASYGTGSGSTLTVDYIYIRKYAAVEPTFGTWTGQDESE